MPPRGVNSALQTASLRSGRDAGLDQVGRLVQLVGPAFGICWRSRRPVDCSSSVVSFLVGYISVVRCAVDRPGSAPPGLFLQAGLRRPVIAFGKGRQRSRAWRRPPSQSCAVPLARTADAPTVTSAWRHGGRRRRRCRDRRLACDRVEKRQGRAISKTVPCRIGHSRRTASRAQGVEAGEGCPLCARPAPSNPRRPSRRSGAGQRPGLQAAPMDRAHAASGHGGKEIGRQS